VTSALQARAFAPAGVGNVAVGFDVLGHVHGTLGDRVTASRVTGKGVCVADAGHAELPLDPTLNTAAVAAAALLNAVEADFGVQLQIQKGIPLCSGLGGSAASAVAAVVAVNALLESPLSRPELYPHALLGEAVASGALHGDNVAPSLLGGMQLLLPHDGGEKPVSIGVPDAWQAVVCHPRLRLRTATARACLPDAFPRREVVAQNAAIAGLVAGCINGDADLVALAFTDHLIEPRRRHLVPGFDRVQNAAITAGALGCSLSGAGPSLFAWARDKARAQRVGAAMVAAFAGLEIVATASVAPIGGDGAMVERV